MNLYLLIQPDYASSVDLGWRNMSGKHLISAAIIIASVVVLWNT